MAESSRPPGRPTKYKARHIEQAEALARTGATDRDLATAFGVSERTINSWKQAHPRFGRALAVGKLHADMMVAERLFQKALEGNTTAMIFWLKNRRPDLWRDRHDHDLAVSTRVAAMSDEELLDYAARLVEERGGAIYPRNVD